MINATIYCKYNQDIESSLPCLCCWTGWGRFHDSFCIDAFVLDVNSQVAEQAFVWFPLQPHFNVCLINGSRAPSAWLIKSEHVPPADGFLCITFTLFFPSKEPQRMFTCVCGCCLRFHVCVQPFAIIGHGQSRISPEGLTRVLRQPKEVLISKRFPDYLSVGTHLGKGMTKPQP